MLSDALRRGIPPPCGNRWRGEMQLTPAELKAEVDTCIKISLEFEKV